MPSIFPSYTLHYTEDVLTIKDERPGKILQDSASLAYDVDDEDSSIRIIDMFELRKQEELALKKKREAELAAQSVKTVDEPTSPDTHLLVQEIIETAEAEAEQIKERAFQTAMADKEQMMQQAQQEAQKLLQDAKAQGLQQGLSEGNSLLKTQLDELEHTVARLEGDLAGFEVELEEQLRWMALEVASRVLNQKVQEDDAILADMVVQTVQSVRNMPWIRIEVAQNMTRLIKKLQNIFDEQEHIEISPIPSEEDVIQIETPSGRLDASVKTQLENLRIYFQKNTE